jgi:hypothetical protein
MEVPMSDNPTRRRVIESAIAGGIGASLAVAGAYAQTAPAKEAKTVAQYQTKPNNGHLCGICTYFQAPSSCQLVDGDIIPTGWCKHFQPK